MRNETGRAAKVKTNLLLPDQTVGFILAVWDTNSFEQYLRGPGCRPDANALKND
jgi:hypothetical protein